MIRRRKAGQAEMDDLHGLIADTLSKRIRSGEYSAAELAVAVKFLKDNGIQAQVTPGNPLGDLANAITDGLPFAGDDGPSH